MDDRGAGSAQNPAEEHFWRLPPYPPPQSPASPKGKKKCPVKRPDMNSFYAEMKLLMPTICYRQWAARRAAATQRGTSWRVTDVNSGTHDATLAVMSILRVFKICFSISAKQGKNKKPHDRDKCWNGLVHWLSFIFWFSFRTNFILLLLCKSLQWVVQDYLV